MPAKATFLDDPLRVLRAIRFGTASFFFPFFHYISYITHYTVHSDPSFELCSYSTAVTGARFGFTLDNELKQAASSEEVRVALGEKISRERIGNEVCI